MDVAWHRSACEDRHSIRLNRGFRHVSTDTLVDTLVDTFVEWNVKHERGRKTVRTALEELGETQAWESRRPDPLLTTKFAIPATRANIVARTRLTDRLYVSPTQRLILVVAPAGWGKTSVVSEWI